MLDGIFVSESRRLKTLETKEEAHLVLKGMGQVGAQGKELYTANSTGSLLA